MEMFEKEVDPKLKTNITLKKLHTWEDVLGEVDRASENYASASDFWAKIRKGLRKLGKNSKAFEGWLELLPTGSIYASVICGGLKMILRVRCDRRCIRGASAYGVSGCCEYERAPREH